MLHLAELHYENGERKCVCYNAPDDEPAPFVWFLTELDEPGVHKVVEVNPNELDSFIVMSDSTGEHSWATTRS